MISKILNSISDFSDKIEDGTIKVCFLHENSKVSKQGWAGFVKPEELYAPENNDNNLGISLIGPQFPGDTILTCIDIDGDKRTLKGESVEQFSKDVAFHIIKRKLDENDIKYMAVKSSSGGYHIYLYTLVESLRYESTKGLIYPKNFTEIEDEDLKMYISGHSNQFLAIAEEEVPKSIVEIWCNKRYMVAPGSDIYDDDGTYIGTTELLYDGVQTFEEISTYKGNLNDLVRQAFLDNNFKTDNRIQNLQCCTRSNHIKFHAKWKTFNHTEEFKKKRSERYSGKNNPMYGKKRSRDEMKGLISHMIKSSKLSYYDSYCGLVYLMHRKHAGLTQREIIAEMGMSSSSYVSQKLKRLNLSWSVL